MQVSLMQVIFFIFSGLTLFSALMVILQNNPVRSVLFLVATFLCSAVLWILVQAEFLALILVLVYVGAVMTLFLFVVMMLNIDREVGASKKLRFIPLVFAVVALLLALLWKALPMGSLMTDVSMKAATMTTKLSDTEALGLVLYTDYWVAFELAAVILLVAIVAAITLVHRAPIRSKRQDVRKQMMTRPDACVTLVSMKAEKP